MFGYRTIFAIHYACLSRSVVVKVGQYSLAVR